MTMGDLEGRDSGVRNGCSLAPSSLHWWTPYSRVGHLRLRDIFRLLSVFLKWAPGGGGE